MDKATFEAMRRDMTKAEEALRAHRLTLRRLLDFCDRARCRKCGAEIWYIAGRDEKKRAFDVLGRLHLEHCKK